MGYLLFMDWLREALVWGVLGALFLLAGFMIWAPRMRRSWTRPILRTLGSILLALTTLASLTFGVFAVTEPPRERIGFRSKQGGRVALFSHSELRDSSATRVTVKGRGLRRYTAYEYFGDGNDYMGRTSVRWLDDHHLEVTYALDPSGVQQCHPQAGDVNIVCHPQPPPAFDSGPKKKGSANSRNEFQEHDAQNGKEN